MFEKIKEISTEIDETKVKDDAELESFRLKFISKKGIIGGLFASFKDVPADQKKDFGAALNELKNLVETKFQEHISFLKENKKDDLSQKIDTTLPPTIHQTGGLHPINQVKNRIIQIFERQGYNVSEGPEIETDWYNFTALNFPENHPAREMQDTYFIEKNPDTLLRTHTSTVQIRLMQSGKPPFRSIMPGRVYRNEAISARAHCFFHQVEGLYIDKDVSFADLKQTLQFFTQELFGKSKIRLRPSYFPFTEPSAEVDVYWGLETETDYRMTKGTGWLEIMGCGMVDPNVLQNCGINSKEYSGFAFGMGIDRIALLLHQIPDIRLLSENDIRFLEQFRSVL